MSGTHDAENDDQGSGSKDQSVTPSAQLEGLDERALKGLREAGAHWPGAKRDRGARERALPVDPGLEFVQNGRRPSGRFVHIDSTRTGDPRELEVTPTGDETDSPLGRIAYRIRRTVIGPPLRSTAVGEQKMPKSMALPVLSPDALSSVAYGPEAMMAVLVLAGTAELKLSLVLGAVIVVLMLAVGLGYRQVIKVYPHGGGSYVVAGDTLGPVFGLIAGAGLTVDYIITVAISVASGVAAITSAIPSLSSATVPIGLAMIALLAAGNLRGARDAGKLFAAPTYLFIVAIFLIVIIGLVKSAGHSFHPIAPAPHHATDVLGVLLILKAFSSGATAMTGIEVISNSVPVFEPPEADNARHTLLIMLGLLISMFVGVVLVAHFDGASPGTKTLLSEIALRSVGSGVLYDYVQVATALVLLIAANSAFNGFPRLLFFMAKDGYAPQAFLHMGDRLAFTSGIFVLAIPAAVLYAGFGGKTSPLIPLFAVGVFVAFTLAQSGMVAHWLRHHDRGWRRALATNALGALLSGVVAIIAAVTKFAAGAWIVVLLIPTIVFVCRRIHRHYQRAHEALRPRPISADGGSLAVPPPRHNVPITDQHGHNRRWDKHLVIVPIAMLDQAALTALSYATELSLPILAVHVSPSDEEAERFMRYWREWGDHLTLEIISSPYRATVAPLTNYIEALRREHPDVTLSVVVPQPVVAHAWQRVLHNRVGVRLKRALVHDQGVVITSIPFELPA